MKYLTLVSSVLSTGIIVDTIHVKPGKNLIFLKNDKNSQIVKIIQGSLKIFLDLG